MNCCQDTKSHYQYPCAGVVGAEVTSRCNPEGLNYRHFLDVLAPNSPRQVLDAGHMQFLDPGAVKAAFYRLLCGSGKIADEEVRRIVVLDTIRMIQDGELGYMSTSSG